jgi:hopanoid biosynthesis associated radical SAM protein HpnJ
MMKTLFLNPPSFDTFDGGASSRWPASREIESYWYPVWLCYPAGMMPHSRVLDAPPHHITPAETVRIARDYDLVVLFTSTPGFQSDVRLAETMKERKPSIKIGFVGPPVSVQPEGCLRASHAVDFVARREFDYSVLEYAQGRHPSQIAGVSWRNNGFVRHNPDRQPLQNLDALPFVTEIYARDLEVERYNVPFLRHPFISLYTTRGCPAMCTFCLWPQTLSGHPWRTRSSDSVAEEVRFALKRFPQVREIFFDDDTFNYKKSRTIELCNKLKSIGFTWSCTSRVTTDYETLKAMKDAGCRLMVVGYESGDPQILKNIKKGATLEQARRFTRDAKKVGLAIHGDFMIGLPGETPESIRTTMKFAQELDCETIQVSVAHPFPGTEFFDFVRREGYLCDEQMVDDEGHQLPNIEYPGLSRADLMDAVERFYAAYYFRPHVAWRVVKRALLDGKERRRLYKEAREYLSLRAKRKLFISRARQLQAGGRATSPAGLSADAGGD